MVKPQNAKVKRITKPVSKIRRLKKTAPVNHCPSRFSKLPIGTHMISSVIFITLRLMAFECNE